MESSRLSIRTPDQRLRVFVSSTLNELAAERKAVRAAIEKLRLAPVMFELGARPHAPRDLYRAYLGQSDVFVGLYWESYGWIAPGEELSGLEDEYRESGSLPRLIYVKEPADDREARLSQLLDRVIVDGDASFKSFTTSEELTDLLESDLATLLAERFDASRHGASGTSEPRSRIPAPLTRLIGRASEERDVLQLLRRDGVRLVTLTGPGGIGKSRLAIDVADSLAADFDGEVAFVTLASVQDPALVTTAIAQAIGVRDTGVGSVDEKLLTALRDRRMLLVLDNFEQVLAAGPILTGILAAAPGVSALVTSRTVLRVAGEYTFEVGPLELPDPDSTPTAALIEDCAAVQLFVERARAVQPEFDVTADNAEPIARICLALDGVPLALELAAARIRLLPPSAMLERLDRRLPLLVGGVRDLPARQQTLRSTIEWSTQLLDDDGRSLLWMLGVFSGAFSLDAVEYLTADTTVTDPMQTLELLVDNSLVRQQEIHGRSLFSILATVREYARDQLDVAGIHDRVRAVHASFYVDFGARAELALEAERQRDWMERLTDERSNIRAAARFLLERRDWTTAAQFTWMLYVYWWVGGHLGEVRAWMDEILDSGDELTDETRAIALYFRYAITFWRDPDGGVVPGLATSSDLFHAAGNRSGEALARVSLALGLLSAVSPEPAQAQDTLETALALFREADDPWGEEMALITLGRVALLQQQVRSALDRFDESLTLARGRGDLLGATIAQHHTGWAHLFLGDVDTAANDFCESLALSVRLDHSEGVAYGFEGLVAVAATRGDVTRAGTLLGASQILREQAGLYNAPTFSFHEQAVAPIRAGARAAELEEARQRGRGLAQAEAVALAIPEDEP